MDNVPQLWNELKAKFLHEFTPPEQLFFLKKARECVNLKGYPVNEDLFNYCYFLTILERLKLIDFHGCEGFTRIMLVQSQKETRDEIKFYERQLEAIKLPIPNKLSSRLLDYIST
jgi:hypothetical protein